MPGDPLDPALRKALEEAREAAIRATGKPRRRRRSPAPLLSSLWPGLGQLYNGQRTKGLLFVAAAALLTVLSLRALPADPFAVTSEQATASAIPGLALLVLWIWSMIDAWRCRIGPRPPGGRP